MKTKRIVSMMVILNMLIHPTTFATNNTEKTNNSCVPNVLSKHCICIERTTQRVLFEKDAYTKCAMASTTKILTGIIVIENCNLEDEVEISKQAANVGGSTLGVTVGQRITIENLLYGLLLRSGNDAAIALAEYLGGSIENFSKLMNQKAKEIGLKNSSFITPHGLDCDGHYTTAYDLAILTNYALKNETFLKIVGTKQISLNIGDYNRVLNNTNELLGSVEGVYGVKTGFTGNAGRCLVTACKRNDLDIIVVVLGADTKSIRGLDSKKIMEYVFTNFIMIDTEKDIKNIFQYLKNNQKFEIAKSLNKIQFDYQKTENYICPIDKNKLQQLRTSMYCLEKLEAPIKKDAVIGKIRMICDNQILYEIDIYMDKPMNRINWKEYFCIFVKKYIMFYAI